MTYQHSPGFVQQSPRNYSHDYQEPGSKRQRSAGPDKAYGRQQPQAPNGWQPQSLDLVHPLQNQQPVPAYNQDNTSMSQIGFPFRTTGDTSMIQQPFVGRQQMPDFGSGQQESPYPPHESSAGQYGHRLREYDLALSNQDQQSVILSGQGRNIVDSKYSQYPLESGDRNPRSSYGHYSQASQPTLLPLPHSTSATSVQPVLPSSPAYNYGPSDGRYPNPAHPQSNMQGSRTYSGYNAGKSLPPQL